MNRFIKIVIFFLLPLSLAYGTSFGDELYQEKIKKIDREIRKIESAKKMSEYFANKYPSQTAHAKSIKKYTQSIEKKKKEKKEFKSEYEKSPKTAIEKLYKDKKEEINKQIVDTKRKVEHYKKYGEFYTKSLKGDLAGLENQLKSLEEGYGNHLKVTKQRQSDNSNLISNGIKNGTIKPVDIKNKKVVSLLDVTKKSQANTAKKLQPVVVNSSGLKSATSLQNVNVGNDAKADVGGVSIGIDEDKK